MQIVMSWNLVLDIAIIRQLTNITYIIAFILRLGLAVDQSLKAEKSITYMTHEVDAT